MWLCCVGLCLDKLSSPHRIHAVLPNMDVLDSDGEFSINPEAERQADEAALRAALHFHVGEICSNETDGKPMTGAAVSTLAEVQSRLCLLYS